MKNLNLHSNALEVISNDVFHYTQGLKEISFTRNHIQTIQNQALWPGMDSLNTLNLGNNLLKTLTKDLFAGAENLVNIFLSMNQIATIQDGAFRLSKLEQLDLADYQTFSDKVFDGAVNLRIVSVAFNNLIHVGLSFYNLRNVWKLALNDNEIDDIDLTLFARLTALKHLSIGHSGFRLDKLEHSTAENSAITRLDISDNELV